jgi:hypothetical protein
MNKTRGFWKNKLMKMVLNQYKTSRGRKHSKIIGHHLVAMNNNNELEGRALMTMRHS